MLHSTVGPSSPLHKAALQALPQGHCTATPCVQSTEPPHCVPHGTALHIPLMLLCAAMALSCVLHGVLHHMPTVAQHRITECIRLENTSEIM